MRDASAEPESGREAPALEIVPPPARDPLRFSPVFVLAPARSNSSVVTAMLGQHPALCVFPELALFRKERVGELLVDPPGWPGLPTRKRLAGVYRALAELHDGTQTPETVAAAARWVDARPSWHVADLLDHLLGLAVPRTGLEKSPESSSRPEYLARLDAAYPRARYLHLTRHPVTTATSMHAVWSGERYWKVEPELFHHFCLGVWYHQHARILEFTGRLPPGRTVRIRSEDVLNDPAGTLPQLCRALGLDAGPDAVEAMLHPERSPYARTGPEGAAGGWDPSFMNDPKLRQVELPASLDLPTGWIVDPPLELACRELATKLGYHEDSSVRVRDSIPVDLSGLGRDAVWAMTGERPADQAL
jgi:Sulfotransferase family